MKAHILLSALVSAAVLSATASSPEVSAQTAETPLPRLISERSSRYCLLVDDRPYFILGGQCGNSSNFPATLGKVWETVEAMNANTLEIPIYWEEIEPVQGRYDFTSLQLLLDQARERDIRLVILWFATWKNGSNHYMPQWMKLRSEKYPNIVGKGGEQIDSPSPHCTASMEADAKAFAEVMGYLKENDPCHTVIMMQIENEPGSWGSVRDYSRAAEKLFSGQVPAALLKPEYLSELGAAGRTGGTWREVFGDNADEYFHAWSVASYIEYVAAAGKAVNPLPMYVNVALRDPLSAPPASHYESGGATDNVIAIYKAAAPHIDLVAPDIYLSGDAPYTRVIELYTRRDNPLMVPETVCGPNKYFYEVVSRGIGFSPFGIDSHDIKGSDPLSLDYALLKPVAGRVAEWVYKGQVYSAFEPEDHTVQRIDLGEWEAVLTFGAPRRSNDIPTGSTAGPEVPATGKTMIVKLGEGDFLACGNNVRYTFRPLGKNEGRPWHYLRVEEGGFDEHGEWVLRRVLNGDETDWTGPYIGSEPTWLRIKVYSREIHR